MLQALLNKLRKRKSVLGIDMGINALKIVELAPDKNGARLVNLALLPTPEGCLNEGLVQDKTGLEQALRELISKINTKTRDVVLTFKGTNVITRQLRLPLMPDRELKQAVEWEMEKYLPMPRQDIYMDYLNFGEVYNGQNKQLNIFVAGVPKDVLYTYYEIFSRIGLDILAIEVLPLALWHGMVKDIQGESPQEATVILDMGANATTLVIYRNEKLFFTRTIPIGGKEIDKSAATMLGISEGEARALKEAHGITDMEQEMIGFPQDVSEKLQFSIKGTLRDLQQEIQRSINFYQVQDKEAQINKVLLVGGMANLKNIEAYMTQMLSLPVQAYTPKVVNMDKHSEHAVNTGLNPVFIPAFGLARREVE